MIQRKKRAILGVLMIGFMLATTLFVFKDNITEAASSVWQCSNCGYRINSGGTNPPRNSYGCGGDFNRRHSFQRIK